MNENESQDITDIENNEDIVLTDDLNLDDDYVLDWNKQEDDAIQDGEAEEVSLGEQAGDSEEVDGSLRDESDQEEYADEGESEEEDGVDSVELGQIYNDEDEDDETQEEEHDSYEDESDSELPEEWDKLLDFLKEFPGASPEDYLKVAAGPEGLSDEDILKLDLADSEGLDAKEDVDEIQFLYDEKFAYDEDLDSERDIKLKQIASKKSLRSAKEKLTDLQLKYGADLTFKDQSPEVKEAMSYQEEQVKIQEEQEELAGAFHSNTKDFFNDKFKGFEFEYGDGKVQSINVGNVGKVSEDQSDIGNFINKFMDDSGQITDLNGYHKSLWAANNVDALFSHAYEQGKADAVRSSAKNAKNIDMGVRQSSDSGTGKSRFKLADEGSHNDDFKFNY